MACGVPVITSDRASIPEVVGQAAVQVDPLDVDQMSAALQMVLEDDAWATELSTRGLAQANQFSWARWFLADTSRPNYKVHATIGPQVLDLATHAFNHPATGVIPAPPTRAP